jgi:hypothetical protein
MVLKVELTLPESQAIGDGFFAPKVQGFENVARRESMDAKW